MPNKLLGKGSLHGDRIQKSYDEQEFVVDKYMYKTWIPK